MQRRKDQASAPCPLPFLRKKVLCGKCGSLLCRDSRSSPNIVWKCQSCGERFGPQTDQELLREIKKKLHELCRTPERSLSSEAHKEQISLYIVRLTNQIHHLLDSRDVDPDELLPLVLECAQEKYSQSRLASNPQEERIRALLAQHVDDEELDPNFFHQVIKGVVLRERCTIPVFHNIRKTRRRLRVAAYCRVSTEEEEQQNSFEVQIQYYTQKICGNPEWELAGIFADEGISGVSTRKRAQFNEMIALCKRRKIDMILTKSISRFARNTLDCIRYVRMLKSWGIRIIFEKENIDTANMNSEMILTCLSSFAQAESESISGNVTKGIRMGYRQGRFVFRYDRFLGYRKGADGKPEIVPEQAESVRQIAQSYLNGNSLREIKRFLEDRNIPSPGGTRVWRESTILSILQNEKYMGDVLLQKSFTTDFMEGKKQKNNGELPQYYIRDNHPAILSRETFYRIQEEISRRNSKRPANAKRAKTNRGRFSSKYALTE